MRVPRRALGIGVGGVVALLAVWVAVVLARGAPSNDRNWAADHARSANVVLEGDQVRIGALRDFRHTPDGMPREGHRADTFDVKDAKAVWFALAPFAERFRGLAHSFVSFEFADGRFLAVSVEARREADEEYGILGGMLRAFEVMYVVGSEEDLIGQRAARGDTLFLYPSVATPEQAGALFRDMMTRAAALQVEPEYYNTLTNNCVTSLRDHINRIAPDPLPWGWGILLPGYSDGWALKHGLLDTALDIEEARSRYRADEKARAAISGGGAFSALVREGPGL